MKIYNKIISGLDEKIKTKMITKNSLKCYIFALNGTMHKTQSDRQYKNGSNSNESETMKASNQLALCIVT